MYNDFDFVYTPLTPVLGAFSFLIDRQNPTKYDYISVSAISQDARMEVIKDLSEKRVKRIITHGLFREKNNPITEYIDENYTLSWKVNDLYVWKNQ